MSKHTHHAIISLSGEEAADPQLCIMVEYGGYVPNTAEMMNSRAGLAISDPNETVVHEGCAPDMAEELARQKDLIAIYERDRTKHLRSIEGADTDLAELGESLGEDIERLKVNEADHCTAFSTLTGVLNKAEAQRDELLEALKDVTKNVKDDSPAMWDRVDAAIEKATP